MENLSIEIVSALTALVAVIVGPLVSIYVVKKEFNANVLSNNRQEWINTLRNTVASFLTETAFMTAKIKTEEDIVERFENVHLHMSKLKLLINPNEEDHVKLIELLDKSANMATRIEKKDNQSENYHPKKHGEINLEIVRISQKILKREWERVKKGK